MTFGNLQTSYLLLQRRLAIYVGDAALPAITLDVPSGDSDEHSFARLVSWGYVLLHETGRVSLGFLRQLPPWNSPSSDLLPHVRALRTWTSHNLSLGKKRDIATIRTAVEWFSTTCGVGTPREPAHWSVCFAALCDELQSVLSSAISACDSFENPEDRSRLVEALKERLARDWEGYRFDSIAEDVFAVLGYTGLAATALRGLKLSEWRTVVATSLEDHIQRNVRLRIEADVLKLMGEGLPLTAKEVAEITSTYSAAELVPLMVALKEALAHARDAARKGVSVASKSSGE